jgi:hypothetical protein
MVNPFLVFASVGPSGEAHSLNAATELRGFGAAAGLDVLGHELLERLELLEELVRLDPLLRRRLPEEPGSGVHGRGVVHEDEAHGPERVFSAFTSRTDTVASTSAQRVPA